MMEKVELKNWDMVRELIKTNRSNMPERINVVQLKIQKLYNGRVYATSKVISPSQNNELFYLDKSVYEKSFVKTVARDSTTQKPTVIKAVVPRFSEAYIEVFFSDETAEKIAYGILKYGNEFYIPGETEGSWINLYNSNVYKDLPIEECIWYGTDNGAISCIASNSDIKAKDGYRKCSLYATYGVDGFNNSEWSNEVHCGMGEELIKNFI